MRLVAIWVTVAPIPVIVLFTATREAEFTVVSVPLAKVDAVGTVFAVIPLMVVTMIAIVVARMIDPDYHFLRRASLGCGRGSECRRQEKETQVFSCKMHMFLRESRTPP